jgi:hypothetical protein
VTVTDTKTNQYWTGSGNAGPEDLTSVEITVSPKKGSTAFTNSEYFVSVTYAPSDLTANLTISGGMTFAGGVTSEKMTSGSEEVDFYGPNVYSSGGPGSGDITVTVSPPASGTNATNGAESASSPGGFSGGSLDVKVPIASFNLSDSFSQALHDVTSALVQSGVSAIMPNLELNTNNYLESLEANGGAQGTAAANEYDYLNNPPNYGYGALTNDFTTLLNDVATGSGNAATPPQIDVLNGPPTFTMPGFPPSAVKGFSVAPIVSASFKYPFISSSGQWQDPKLGDLLTTFGISGKGPINDDTLVPISGNWTGSLTAALSAGHNFTLESGSYSFTVGFDVDLFNNKNIQLAVQATGTFTPADGNLQNDLAGTVVAGFAHNQ